MAASIHLGPSNMPRQPRRSAIDCPERILDCGPPRSDGQNKPGVEPAYALARKSESTIRQRVRELLGPLITSALALAIISFPSFSQTRSTLNPVHALDDPAHAFNLEEPGSR